MWLPRFRRSLSALVAAACCTVLAPGARAAAPLSTKHSAALTIGATVVRSCAVGTNTGPSSFSAQSREALVAASYAALDTTCNAEGARVQLTTAQVQFAASGDAVLDVEF